MAIEEKKSQEQDEQAKKDPPYADIFPGIKWDYSKAGQTFVILKTKIGTASEHHKTKQSEQEGNEESPKA